MPKTILVVDDAEALYRLYDVLLNGLGYNSVILTSGAEAHEKITGGLEYDIAIFDKTLEDKRITGDSLAKLSLELHPTVPVIRASAMPVDDNARDPRQKYIQKPFTLAELGKAIEEACAEKQAKN